MKGKKSKKPFFASFLEKQVQDPETVKGGSITSVVVDNVTNSLRDNVTKPGGDNVTMKYPSDGDEDATAV